MTCKTQIFVFTLPGFSTPFIIPEGQSDKHIAEEDYYTADEEDLNKHCKPVWLSTLLRVSAFCTKFLNFPV